MVNVGIYTIHGFHGHRMLHKNPDVFSRDNFGVDGWVSVLFCSFRLKGLRVLGGSFFFGSQWNFEE